MTNSIGEVIGNDVLFIIGSNATEAHPIIGNKMKRAHLRGAKLIVADPRRTEIADHAHLWLQLKPGTDNALINGIMHTIITNGWHDQAYIDERTEGYDELWATVKDYPAERAAEITGIAVESIVAAAKLYATTPKAGIFYTLGITEHTVGTANVMNLANLAMITGHIGVPNAGINPMRGQNNVQGACDMGALPNSFPGYSSINDEAARAKFEAAYGVPIAEQMGLRIPEMFDLAVAGQLKAMYIMGEDPALTDADANHVRKALANLDFLVVQNIFMTETAKYADVFLPASLYAEKEGTFTNTDRRVQLSRKVLDPPGQARVDWEVVQDIANRIGLDWHYESPRQIFDEMVSVIPSYTNLTYDNLGLTGKLYPNPDPEHSDGTVVMFGTKFNTDDGLAHLVPAEWLPAKELPDADYPFVLNTGRMLEHWHTGSMTRRSYALDTIAPRALVYIHPDDAASLGLADGDMARVTSRRGSIELAVNVSHREARGNCFIPFHFREAAANLLTIDEIDPFGKIPEFKFCAVRVEPAGQPARAGSAGPDGAGHGNG